MTLCCVTGFQCNCQPDEGVFCPDMDNPSPYVKACHDAITELRDRVRSQDAVIAAADNLFANIDKVSPFAQVRDLYHEYDKARSALGKAAP